MTAPSVPLPSQAPSRIASLDALRGFDMCWILGLDAAVTAFLAAFFPESPVAKAVSAQLSHVGWQGFHFYDLIFPLFVFLTGVSSAIALPRRLEREGFRATVRIGGPMALRQATAERGGS